MNHSALFFFVFTVTTISAQAEDMPMTAEHVTTAAVTAVNVFNVQVSPDGAWVSYETSKTPIDAKEPIAEAWVQNNPAQSGQAQPPLALPKGSVMGGWHFDGRLKLKQENPTNPEEIFLFDPGSGTLTPFMHKPLQDNPRRISSFPIFFGRSSKWSASRRYIAFKRVIKAPKRGRLDSIKGSTLEEWQGDDTDFNDRPQGLFLLTVATGEIRQLTSDDTHISDFDWSPDESSIVFSVRHESDRSAFGLVRHDLAVVDRVTGKSRPLVSRYGNDDTHPLWSPDGRWIAFTGYEGDAIYAQYNLVSTLHLISPTGGKVRTFKKTQISGTPMVSAQWSEDSQTLRYCFSWDMRVVCELADTKDLTVKELQPFGSWDTGSAPPFDDDMSISADGKWMAYTRQSATVPPEVFMAKIDRRFQAMGAPVQITHLNENFLLSTHIQLDRITWTSQDSEFELHGLLYTPLDAWKQGKVVKPLPTVLAIMGGPSKIENTFARHWGVELSLAARGYAVFVPSTRGREGYGEKFSRGIAEARGSYEMPYLDAMTGINHLIAQGITDPLQMGIFGHSYGGGLAAYASTQTNRFKAVVNHEGGTLNELTYIPFGGSVNTLGIRDMKGIYDPFDPVQRTQMINESSLLNANRVQIPTLLIYGSHSEPLMTYEAIAFLKALRRFKVPSEMLIFDMGHVPEVPAQIVGNVACIVEWLDYWVRGLPFSGERAVKYRQEWQKH